MTLRRATPYAAGLAMVLGLAACGGTGADGQATPQSSASAPTTSTTSPGTTTTSSPSATASTSAVGRTLEITVKGKTVTPAPSTVDLAVGESLTLVVTSDHDDEIHAHGFDVSGELRAGQASTVVITGTDPGVYEVETHEPALRLLMVAVR